MLLEIAGKPLILHTLGQAKKASNVSRVIVATDDERILAVVRENGGEAMMTSAGHRSGSDRLAEVAATLPSNSIIVNVQGDEPTISPLTIDLAVNAMLADDSADIVTTCEKIAEAKDVLDPNIVKVVTDINGYAIYFSRSPIPYPRTAMARSRDWEQTFAADPGLLDEYRKHTGIYVYRRDYLLKFAAMTPTRLETIEMLEQLRALENGAKIKVVETDEPSIGVDTPEDLERVRLILSAAVVEGSE
ncbi:3-deoxy-manno-octulosonate cytidylyltransferase [soil metagenome]